VSKGWAATPVRCAVYPWLAAVNQGYTDDVEGVRVHYPGVRSGNPGVNGVSHRGLRNVSFRLRNVSFRLRNASFRLRNVSLNGVSPHGGVAVRVLAQLVVKDSELIKPLRAMRGKTDISQF
jgi:hypothetical protein